MKSFLNSQLLMINITNSILHFIFIPLNNINPTFLVLNSKKPWGTPATMLNAKDSKISVQYPNRNLFCLFPTSSPRKYAQTTLKTIHKPFPNKINKKYTSNKKEKTKLI